MAPQIQQQEHVTRIPSYARQQQQMPQQYQQQMPQQYQQQQQKGPYQLDYNNFQNFKGGKNPYELNRTVVNPNLISAKEPIDFVGYNAQGEKVNDPKYYNKALGRVNEFDYYREYKKLNNNNFLPSNQHQMSEYAGSEHQNTLKSKALSKDNVKQLPKNKQ
jgi:hypothetical protein